LALGGNIQISLPGHTGSPFAWLESIAPPVLVLSTAYVLKEQLLEAIQHRHANERAFQEALHDWQQATSQPEDHSQWFQFYANALRDALLKVNSRRKETLNDMTVDDWRSAVYRETLADQWYERPESGEETLAVALDGGVNSIRRDGNGTLPKVSAAIGSGAV
jgi:hypothetical protein